MKRFLSILIVLTCLAFSAKADHPVTTPAVKFLEANEDAKGTKCMKLEGLMLKMARPTLKKTPVAAIIDELDVFYMLSFKADRQAEGKAFQSDAMKVLSRYIPAGEINDNVSHMLIFLNQQDGDMFHEMVLLNISPTTSMMVFHGDFKEASLRRMDEISKKQREEGTGILSGMYRDGQMPE